MGATEEGDADDTDWPQILALSDLLEQLSGNPMVTLNRAVAAAMLKGPAYGDLERAEEQLLHAFPRLSHWGRVDDPDVFVQRLLYQGSCVPVVPAQAFRSRTGGPQPGMDPFSRAHCDAAGSTGAAVPRGAAGASQTAAAARCHLDVT